jgi:hypothetical protein
MGTAVSLLMIAAGAIMAWVVFNTTTGFGIYTVGIILMVVGAVGLVLSIVFWSSWGGFSADVTAARPPSNADRSAIPTQPRRKEREATCLLLIILVVPSSSPSWRIRLQQALTASLPAAERQKAASTVGPQSTSPANGSRFHAKARRLRQRARRVEHSSTEELNARPVCEVGVAQAQA